MNFQEVNRLLYKGYLYSLILGIVAVVSIITAVLAAIASYAPIVERYPGTSPRFLIVLTILLVSILAFAVADLVIFFLYLFRGYMALHKLGIGWAWWQAWGPIVLFAIGVVSVGVLLASLPSLASYGGGLEASLWVAVWVAIIPLALLVAFGLFVDITHILFLNNMYDYTKISKFHTAYILYIIGLVLSFIPYVNAGGSILMLVEYIIEMLAYKEASAWTPPSSQPAVS